MITKSIKTVPHPKKDTMFHIPTKNAREGIQKPLAAAQFRIGVYRIKRLEKKRQDAQRVGVDL